jgi:hypothetical protein
MSYPFEPGANRPGIHPTIALVDLPPIQTMAARLPFAPPGELKLVRDHLGRAFVIVTGQGNPYALEVGCRQLNNYIRRLAAQAGISLRKGDVEDFNEQLRAAAELSNIIVPTWYRNAPIPGGVELDLGDEARTRVRITAGKVELVREGSETVFYRTPVSRPFVMPAETGDLGLLRPHVNLGDVDYWLFLAWLSYTLAHPKCPTTKFVLLVIQGDQGSGKTYLCAQVILNLLDPNVIGVQMFPESDKDVAIAAQNALVLLYDNMRHFKSKRSDLMCIVLTGGTISNRALYTDADLHTHHLHVALVLNGIHNVLQQPDLAQRSLPIHTLPMNEKHRKSEAELVADLHSNLPAIFRGLLDLISQIFVHLPGVAVLHPERMLDFVRWLSALEKAQGFDPGYLQAAYSNALKEAQEDSLEQNSLGAAMVEFADRKGEGCYTFTPAALLSELNEMVTVGTTYARDWPRNPIALSLRLNGLKASLQTQGIHLVFRRGKQREIIIIVEGRDHD